MKIQEEKACSALKNMSDYWNSPEKPEFIGQILGNKGNL